MPVQSRNLRSRIHNRDPLTGNALRQRKLHSCATVDQHYIATANERQPQRSIDHARRDDIQAVQIDRRFRTDTTCRQPCHGRCEATAGNNPPWSATDGHTPCMPHRLEQEFRQWRYRAFLNFLCCLGEARRAGWPAKARTPILSQRAKKKLVESLHAPHQGWEVSCDKHRPRTAIFLTRHLCDTSRP